MNTKIDGALSAPLPQVPDNGFSQRVMLGVMKLRARQERNIALALASGAATLCALMPLTAVGQSVDRWALDFAGRLSSVANSPISFGGDMSMPLAIAAVAVLLTAFVAQALPEWLRS